MPEAEDVRTLVDKAREGDREALAALFDRYYERVYRYALMRLGRVADAEDAAAETFARVVSGISRFRWRKVPFIAWVFGIARHVVADSLRERSGAPSELHQDDAGSVAGPEEDLMWIAHASALRDAFGHLTEAQQQVVLLRFAGDLSAAEVGAAMGKTAGAVRVLQLRALERLRDVMGAEVL
jgi:RNA polymerase sigma-70 factor, ECF subfamily